MIEIGKEKAPEIMNVGTDQQKRREIKRGEGDRFRLGGKRDAKR